MITNKLQPRHYGYRKDQEQAELCFALFGGLFTEKQLATYHGHWVLKLSPRQMADAEGITEQAANRRIYLFRQMLKRRMTPESIALQRKRLHVSEHLN